MMMLKMMLPVRPTKILLVISPIRFSIYQSMPKMGGDDKDDKKEESAESKAEKEAAVIFENNYIAIN